MKFLSDSEWKVMVERLEEYERRIVNLEARINQIAHIISMDMYEDEAVKVMIPSNDGRPKLSVVSDNTK